MSLEELNKYRKYVLSLILIIFTSYICQFSEPLPIINRNIFGTVFWISLVLCLVITTNGVVKFSQKIGKFAYFFVLTSLIGAVCAFAIDTLDIIEEISLFIYYVCLLASLIAGVIAIVKGEKGLAKLSGFILLLLIGLIIICTLVAWGINGGGF